MLHDLNALIDYTLLEPSASEKEIIELCQKAIMLQVKSVCVLPQEVNLAARQLANSDVLVCSVVSFPEGKNSLSEKVAECQSLIQNGAHEIDVVLNYHQIDNQELIMEELLKLAEICKTSPNKKGEKIVLKIIVESGRLSLEQTHLATLLCINAGVDFIKTSTGKVEIGAELSKIKMMRQTIEKEKSSLKIKASGGIRSMQTIDEFLPFVDRLGIGYKTVDQLNALV